MFEMTINFADLVLAALLAGAMFGVWLVFNPAGLDARSYVALHQRGVRVLHPVMPGLGGGTILATMAAAVFVRSDAARFWLLIAATLSFVVAGLVTRFLNQPINAIVMQWKSEAPPSDWTRLRDAWWRWHSVRLASGLVGFCLLVAATLRHGTGR